MDAAVPWKLRATHLPVAMSCVAVLAAVLGARRSWLFSQVFGAVELRSGLIVALCSFHYFIVWCRLVFKIIRRHVIFTHGVIFELIPHQDPAQVRMPLEMDAIEIENLPFLQFRTAPNRSERW